MTIKLIKKILYSVVSLAAVIALLAGCNSNEVYRLIKVKSYEGAVTVERKEKMNAFEGLQLISEDKVEVGNSSFLELLADSDKHIAVEENTAFKLLSSGDEKSGNITVELLYGKSFFTIDNKLPEGSTFEVNTPNAMLSVRGTIFRVSYDPETNETFVMVMEGVVAVTTAEETMELTAGKTVTITTDRINRNGETEEATEETSKTTEEETVVETTALPETTTSVITTSPITTATTPETTTTPATTTTAKTTKAETTTTTAKTTKAKTTTTSAKVEETASNGLWMDTSYSDSTNQFSFFTLKGYLEGYIEEFDLNEKGQINLYINQPDYQKKSVGDGKALESVFSEWSDVVIEHMEELDEMYFDKFYAEGFENEEEFTGSIIWLSTDFEPLDTTDWFPETSDFSYNNKKYRLTLVRANMSHCSVVADSDKDDISVSDKSPKYKLSNGDIVYIESHSYHFGFSFNIKKLN